MSTGAAGYCAARGGGDNAKLDVAVTPPTAGAGSLAVVLTRGAVGDADYQTTSYSKVLTVAAANASAVKSTVTVGPATNCSKRPSTHIPTFASNAWSVS